MNVEQQILSQVIHTERYARAVLPYLKEEYFSDAAARSIFEIIRQFTGKYASIPTIGALQVEADSLEIEQDKHDAVMATVELLKVREPVDIEWMVDKTEQYCQERAMDLAMREAITVQQDPKRSKGEIPHIMQQALNVSFKSDIGHDYFEDAEKRYDQLHSTSEKIPFDVEAFNQATEGGVERKTLNILMAGCVHPETLVTARYTYEGIEREKRITMYKLKELLGHGIAVEVQSPNGYVNVAEFVEKGVYQEFNVFVPGGKNLRCNADHLIKTYWGWERAETLARMCATNATTILVETENGPQHAMVVMYDTMIPIVDIVVDHEDHSYYANGFESHNTNVGKSLIMCHLAAADVLKGKSVLYVTFEMAQEKIAQRIDANLLDLPLEKYKDMPRKWFVDKISDIKKKCGGRIVVQEYASNSAHVGHIRNLLADLKQKKGFVPDVIYIDYINIMACQRYRSGQVPKHQYVQAIAEEQRALAQTENIPVWTATQTNREGFKSSDADIGDVAEAWGLPLTADWFLIILQPDELAELGQYLCKQEKSRYSNKDRMRRFIIGVDKSKQKIFDIDVQPNLAGGQYEADEPVFDQTPIGMEFESFRS